MWLIYLDLNDLFLIITVLMNDCVHNFCGVCQAARFAKLFCNATGNDEGWKKSNWMCLRV